MENNSSPTITENTITSNFSEFEGGGICVHSGTVIINANTINSNTAGWHGGGIFLGSSSTASIIGNTIHFNTSPNSGGGIFVCHTSTLLPAFERPLGWGTTRENIPPSLWYDMTIAGNTFSGNSHGGDPNNGAQVYFYKINE